MSYLLSFQQGGLYRYCSKCGTLLSLIKKNRFEIGHNYNYCYHCGHNLNETDFVNINASWDLELVKDIKSGEIYIYNPLNNVLYKNIPQILIENYKVEKAVYADNFEIKNWNFKLYNYTDKNLKEDKI